MPVHVLQELENNPCINKVIRFAFLQFHYVEAFTACTTAQSMFVNTFYVTVCN